MANPHQQTARSPPTESRQRDCNYLSTRPIAPQFWDQGLNPLNPGNGTETIPFRLELIESDRGLNPLNPGNGTETSWNAIVDRLKPSLNPLNPGNGTETSFEQFLRETGLGFNPLNPGNGTETIHIHRAD